jgi:LPXTG-site transpeptidase (sortase) family protein
VRVCNRSGTAVNNVVADFVWDTSNSYIDIRPGTSNTLSVASLANDACTDFYFEVEVSRDTNAYDTTREYHIEVTSTETGATIFSTPTPRELFVERLVSQNRNAVTDVQFSSNSDCSVLADYVSVAPGGTMSLNVDTAYCIKVIGTTATNGYEQIESFITLPNTIFQVLSVETTYTADSSTYIPDPATAPLHKKLYGDACSWENDPNSPNYLACNDVGKAGGGVEITYQVYILSAPSVPLVNPEPLTTLLYDFSGSSFHYNSDFGISTRYMYIVDPSLVTIEKQFVPDTIAPGDVSTIKFTVTNPTPTTVSGVKFDDTFPTSPAAMIVAGSPNVSYGGCGSGAFSPALSGGEASVSFSNGSIAPNSSCVIKVDVTVPVAGDYLNTTGNLFVNSTTDTGNSASATLTAATVASCVPGQTLVNWTMPTGATFPPDTAVGVPTTNNTGYAATAYHYPVASQSTVNGTSSPDGTSDDASWATWGYKNDGGYVEFVVDTRRYSNVQMAFMVYPDGNGPDALTVIYDGNGSGTAASYVEGVNLTSDIWNYMSVDLSTYASTTGTTTIHISGTGATNDNSGAVAYFNDVAFTGCLEADPPPTISKTFAPDTIPVNTISTLTFAIHNTDAAAVDLTGVQVSDTLPTGVEVASTPNASTDCTGGSISAPAGGSTIALTGASMLAGTSCTMQVDVIATSAGQFDNVSDYISSNESGENKNVSGYATDTLVAIAPPSITKSFSASPILEGSMTILSFTITNPNQATDLTGVAFTDTLPAEIDVANASSAQCGGTLNMTDNNPTADTVELSGATLTANDSCMFNVTVAGTVAGDYTNTTDNVTSTNGGTGNTASSDLIVNPITPQVSMLKQVGSSNTGPWNKFLQIDALPNNVYYRFVIENTGNVNMTSLNITDPTLGMIGDMSGCGLLGSNDLAFSEPLVPGDYAYCIYGPVAASAGSHTNTATAHATYNGTEYDSSDKSATYGTSAITLTKSASPNYFTTTGDTLSYSYIVTNSGYADLLGPVSVADDKVSVTCPDVSTVGDGDAWFDQGESITCTSVADYVTTDTDVSNDYAANTATATISGVDSNTVVKRVSLIGAVKSVVTTSEDGTSGSNVSIGEVVRYRLVVDLSEGTTDAVEILDSIVTNMSYLNDGTTKVAFVSDSGGTCNVTSSDAAISGAGLCVVGNQTILSSITPTFMLPSSAIVNNDGGASASPFPTGDDPLFSLGNITNNDSDDNEEYIIIEFNSLVRNYAANQDGNSRSNSFSVSFDGVLVDTSNSVNVNLVEPVIDGITKSVTTAPNDAGDQIVYTLEFTNTGNAPAYDIVMTDTLDSVLTGNTVTVAGSTTGGACGSTASVVNGSFTIPTATTIVSCLNPGGTATVTITVNISDTAEAGYTFTNSAGLTYTSLPDATGTPGASNPTGSSTPGGSGTSSGERNGSGGTNDYIASSNTVTTTLAAPSLAKTVNPAGTQYAVGAAIPYQITVTLPEGVINNAVIEENIPNNLTYIFGSLSVTFGTDVASSMAAPYTDANATFYDLTGQVMTLDFDTLTSTASTSANNRTMTITFNVTVDNVAANQSGTSFTNSVDLIYDDPNSAGQLTIPALAPTVSIIEPGLNVNKGPSTTKPTYNSTLTYTLTVAHDFASNAPAYDVVIIDVVPAGLTGLTNISVTSVDGGGTSCAVGVDTTNSTGTTLDIQVGILPNGCTLIITYDVTTSGTGGSTQTNDVDMTWTSLSGSVAGERDGGDGPGSALDDYSASTSVDVTISGMPDYTITKTATSVDSAGNGVIDNAGESIFYQIVIVNTGTLDITGVDVTDSLITLGGPTGDAGSDNILGVGETWTYTGNYEVTQTDMNNNGGGDGDIDNTASITSDQISTSRTSSEEVPLTQNPALALTKTGALDDMVVAPSGVANVGDQITYSFNVENTGNVNLTNIVVTDPLLPSLGCTMAGPLMPGTNASCAATNNVYTLTQADINAGERNNTATATGKDPGDNDVTDNDLENVALTQSPAISIVKSSDATGTNADGDTIIYSYDVENTGNVTLTNVTVTDAHTGLSAITCIPAQDSALNPGDTMSCSATYTVTQADANAGQIDNTGVVTGTDPTSNQVTDNDPLSEPVAQNPAISIVKSSDATGTNAVGDTITYSYDVENTGNVALTNVTVTDAHIGLSAITCTPAQGLDLNPADTMSCSASYTVTQADVNAGQIDNTGVVAGTDPGSNLVTDNDLLSEPIAQNPALTLTKTGTLNDDDGTSGVSAGDTISYSFQVENTGNVTLTNISVTDPLVDPITCPSGNPIPSLTVGNSETCTGTYTVTQADINAGVRDNTASASSAEDATDMDSESIPLTQNPSLMLTKTLTGNADEDSSGDVSLGDTLTFSVTMTNTGNITLTSVSVSDADLTPNNQTCANVVPEAMCVLTGTYVIQQADVDAGQFQNTGSVVDDTVCPGAGAGTCEDTITTPISNNPGIRITKSLSGVVFDSPQLLRMTYSILVENTGDVALYNLQVTDDLASAFASATSYSVVSVLPGPFTLNSNFDGEADINLLGGTDTLDSGDSGTITLVVLVDTGGKAETYRNTTEATGEPPDDDPVSDDDFADGPAFVDPAVTKAVSPDQAAVGDQVTYTITVFNNGTQPAADVVVTDTFPANLDLVLGSVTVNPPVNASNPPDYITITALRTLEVRLGTLDVDDVYVIKVQAVVNSLGQPPIQNTVNLSTSSPTPWAGNLSSNDQSSVALNMTDDPGVRALPDTGFAPNKMTTLPPQPANLTYADLGEVWLEIPSLGVRTSIVGVPRSAGAWNVDWLGDQAGWLQGTAFPSWQGNSVVTGHVYLSNGQPGPFVNLSGLRWGDQIIVHTFGQRHIYEIQTNRYHSPDDLSALKHEDQAWLTLITCRGYEETSDSYKYRIVTRAILTNVEAEQ